MENLSVFRDCWTAGEFIYFYSLAFGSKIETVISGNYGKRGSFSIFGFDYLGILEIISRLSSCRIVVSSLPELDNTELDGNRLCEESKNYHEERNC